MTDDRRERLEWMWRQAAPRVQACAIRRVGREGAGDVVSEVFLAAWRRLDDVPDDALGWLLVTARNVIATSRRSAARHPSEPVEAAERFASLAGPGPVPVDVAVDRDELLRAL